MLSIALNYSLRTLRRDETFLKPVFLIGLKMLPRVEGSRVYAIV